MNWREKFQEIFFSYGLMGSGLLLLLASTVYISRPAVSAVLADAGQAVPSSIGGDITPGSLPQARPIIPLPKDDSKFDKIFSAVSVFAVDDKSETVLFQKNSAEVRPLASITKLMSALVILDSGLSWNATTTILADDDDGSSHFVAAGEVFTLDDLWHVALIGSSNGAIKALARATGLAADEFVRRMNQKAVQLKMTTAKFVEPTGLDDQNVASAEDTAKLLAEALRSDKIYKTLQIGEYYAEPLGKKKRRVWTTDWLLTNWIPNEFKVFNIAGKTGFINNSKYNFAVRLAKDDTHAVRVVIMGADSNETRFTEARDLAAWIFEKYVWPDESGYDKITE